MDDLKKLNSVYKRDYIKMTCEEDDKVMNYLKVTDVKLQESHDQVVDLMYGIDDTQEVWDQQINTINEAIVKKAVEFGLDR